MAEIYHFLLLCLKLSRKVMVTFREEKLFILKKMRLWILSARSKLTSEISRFFLSNNQITARVTAQIAVQIAWLCIKRRKLLCDWQGRNYLHHKKKTVTSGAHSAARITAHTVLMPVRCRLCATVSWTLKQLYQTLLNYGSASVSPSLLHVPFHLYLVSYIRGNLQFVCLLC